MISNYSHDHIALDTMNIMANGQYIDQIMTNNQFYICILGVKVSRQEYRCDFCGLMDEFFDRKKINRSKIDYFQVF